MKSRTVKALLCATLMALTLSMTACGGSNDAAQGADTAAEEVSTEEETASVEEETPAEEETASVEEEAPAEEEASSTGATLEEYLKGDAEAEKQLEEQAQSMGNDQMDMAIEVNGNDLVYVATLKEAIEDGDALAETVNEQVGPTFSSLAGMMDEVVGAEKGTVSFGIRYCNPDGSVLAEATFRAE